MTTKADVAKAWTGAAYEVRMWLCEILVGLILMILPKKHKDGPLLAAGIDHYIDLTILREITEINNAFDRLDLEGAFKKLVEEETNKRFEGFPQTLNYLRIPSAVIRTYTMSCHWCGHLWDSTEAFPLICPKCGRGGDVELSSHKEQK